MKRWNKDDIAILSERYAETSNPELAKLLGRSTQAVALRGNQMGLRKSASFLADNVGFRKGYTPFNKGRKMEEWLSPAVHGKIKANQARTAERNRSNAMPEGTISRHYDGDHIKIGRRWIKLAHHIWATHNGPIPKGYAVFYRDGDCFNSAIENLFIDVANNASVLNKHKSPEERSARMKMAWETRRRKQAEKHADLDRILEEIRKSDNNIYYKPKI